MKKAKTEKIYTEFVILVRAGHEKEPYATGSIDLPDTIDDCEAALQILIHAIKQELITEQHFCSVRFKWRKHKYRYAFQALVTKQSKIIGVVKIENIKP